MSTETTFDMIYFCCDEHRRASVRAHATLNGIDFLEVVDRDQPAPELKQFVLHVHLLKTLVHASLTAENIEITGGVRVVGVRARDPVGHETDLHSDDVIVLHVTARGDFSNYTLRLVEATGGPLAGFDPLLSAVDFSFKVDCPSDFDCREGNTCAVEPLDEPEIDYLSKDFNSFRGMMLDRLSAIIPEWRERNLADLGITLVELLAYVGDYLSYQQDAIATEAYLGTARRRISVRRHARLVDYAMSDGCNARVWVQIRTSADEMQLDRGQLLFTRVPQFQPVVTGADNFLRLIAAAPEAFETMHAATLHAAHNRMRFYTWGDRECCLPKGATRAALAGHFEKLASGDLLLFQEEIGPRTGDEADADRTHRHAVRLTRVPVLTDDPVNGDPHYPAESSKWPKVTLIEWGDDDALPFALCISAVADDGTEIPAVSVALGNIVLADNGRTIPEEPLGAPPVADPNLAFAGEGTQCGDHERVMVPPRFRPRLKNGPLTNTATTVALVEGGRKRVAFDPNASAAEAFRWEMSAVVPAVTVTDDRGGIWHPQRDLLASDAFAPEFVAEVEEDGRATLRFGDDQYGMMPAPLVPMRATYRIGNGTRGNIGADSLAHIFTSDSRITSVYNPLPAREGTDPESLEHVRQSAPAAFFRQERAVTTDDYAEVTQRNSRVQRAAATRRWTGSWNTIFVSVDRYGGGGVDSDFEEMIEAHLERYRMAGHDLEIDGPRQVPLEIEADVCVAAGYYRSDVKRVLLETLSSRSFAGGRRGLFHPDNFTFGQSVYLSKLYAAAQGVTGVGSILFRTFRRYGSRDGSALESGVLEIGRLEIARLDNDRSVPENGVIRLTMGGGR